MFGSGGNMSRGDLRGQLIIHLNPSVLCKFCQVMDGLSDLDWTRFASEVLKDQTDLRYAEKQKNRTDGVMQRWGIRNGRVGELIDLLESLQLFRPRDIILSHVNTSPPAPPPPPYVPLPKTPPALPTVECSDGTSGGKLLPGPAPPPVGLYSQEVLPAAAADVDVDGGKGDGAAAPCSSFTTVMRWSYEEVHAGTGGFSPTLQVGEGGFGVVYRATLNNTDCAVKRLRQDGMMDWSLLEKSFQTEVEKLSKFRHRNIVDLLGFSEGRGTMCLIYSYMDNRSLEDQIHNASALLSWPHRVSIVEGAAAALQFLHRPPAGQEQLIHGDVKSSNILLDQHLVAKLSDFGLARYAPPSGSERSQTQTGSVAKTATVRGTLAYLPNEYVLRGQLHTAVDVYSFGVVLLEVLTGRRALEKDRTSRERYLKDLVWEVQPGPDGSTAEMWKNQLDRRLISGGSVEPVGCQEVGDLAFRSLIRQRKKRPSMTEVFEKLKIINSEVRKASSLHHSPHQSFPRPSCSLNVDVVSQQMSKLGPLEHSYPPSSSSSSSSSSSFSSLSSFSSSSSSSSCALTPPHPLHSSILPPPSSFIGPCETDESRGFSQCHLPSQVGSNSTSCRSLTPPTGDRNRSLAPAPPSVPTEDQYPLQPSCSGLGSVREASPAAGLCGFSPAGSLRSISPGLSVQVNPSKQRLLEKKSQYEEGRIGTPELLSSHDLYGGRSADVVREPEESDELDYLPDRTR